MLLAVEFDFEFDFGLPLVAPFDVERELLRYSLGDLYGGPLPPEFFDCLVPAVDGDGDVEGGVLIALISDLQRECRPVCRGVVELAVRRPHLDWPQGRRIRERASSTVVVACLLRIPAGRQGERAVGITFGIVPGQLGQETLSTVVVAVVGEEHQAWFVAAEATRLEVERSPVGALVIVALTRWGGNRRTRIRNAVVRRGQEHMTGFTFHHEPHNVVGLPLVRDSFSNPGVVLGV